MTKHYIALLRAINVGGHQPVKMTALCAAFSELGFQNVQTHIQSGNVVFHSEEKDTHTLKERIETHLKNTFGHPIPTILRTHEELKTLAELSEVKSYSAEPGKYFYISFLDKTPVLDEWYKLISTKNERETVYLHVADVISIIFKELGDNTAFVMNKLEKQLGVQATVRNWNTLQKLVELSK